MNVNALWGKLGAEILTQNLEVALEDLNKLKELIDEKVIRWHGEEVCGIFLTLGGQSFVSHLFQLQQRTWLIHWSLFVFFNHPEGRDGIIDLFFQTQWVQGIRRQAGRLRSSIQTRTDTSTPFKRRARGFCDT